VALNNLSLDDAEDEWSLDGPRHIFVYKPVLKKTAKMRKVREYEMLVRLEKRLNDDRAAAIAKENEEYLARQELVRCQIMLGIPYQL